MRCATNNTIIFFWFILAAAPLVGETRVDNPATDIKTAFDESKITTRSLLNEEFLEKQIDVDKPENSVPEVKDRRTPLNRNYYSFGVGGGLMFLLGDLQEIFNPSTATLATYFNYNFRESWGLIGTGLYCETDFPPWSTDYGATTNPITLLNGLVGFNVRYTVPYYYPFFLYGETDNGLAIHRIETAYGGYFNQEDLYIGYTVFSANSLGIGFYFNPWFGLAFNESLLFIYFNNHSFWGLASSLRLELNW